MTSIQDLAALAADVYDRSGNTIASAAGWLRLDGQNWAPGFAAGRYQRGSELVVAYRGTDTDDSHDLLSDALMVPASRPGAVRTALEQLLRSYGIGDDNAVGMLAPRALEAVTQTDSVSAAIRSYANQVPGEQLRSALAYFDGCRPRPRFVCGHSLGGALAQLVAQERSVPAVAFNSPFMGDVRGVVLASTQLILAVNANLDPLSLATQSIGNLPHGRVITVQLPPFRPPPSFRRRPISWGTMLLSPAYELGSREAEARRRYYSELLDYLGAVALYGHGMDTLRQAVGRDVRFARALRDDLVGA